MVLKFTHVLGHFSHVRLLATPGTVASQAPHPWNFLGKNTGVLFPPPGNLPDPGTESASLMSLPLTGGFFITVLC